MIRGDPQDRGPDYRNVIGIPAGLGGPLGAVVDSANIFAMPLLQGGGADGNPAQSDNADEGVVYGVCVLLAATGYDCCMFVLQCAYCK